MCGAVLLGSALHMLTFLHPNRCPSDITHPTPDKASYLGSWSNCLGFSVPGLCRDLRLELWEPGSHLGSQHKGLEFSVPGLEGDLHLESSEPGLGLELSEPGLEG